ncbi:MAG: major facilitator superfamily 1 [Firmicutes bacterium]|nr:major facilitator superfamily 1 [Bacillota bacterium]
MQKNLEQTSQEVTEKKTRFRWVVAAMTFLVYMIAGADRANVGVVIPFIKESFQLTNTDIGAMTSLFYIGYAIIQVPAGIYFGKTGVRKSYSVAIILTSLATFFMGLATSIFHLKAARLLLGFAEGPLNIGIITTINRWFPPQEKGIATGIYMASIKFAPAIVPPLCAYIMITFGWREVFYLFSIPGFISAALWWWLVKDDPKDSPYCSKSEVAYITSTGVISKDTGETKTSRSTKSLKWLDKLIRTKKIRLLATNQEVLRSWNVWGCALGYFFLVGITYAIMTWVPTYLVTVKKFSIMKMGFVAAAPWIGAMLGNLIGGWLSDKVFDRRRKPNMMLTAASTVGMMYSLLYAPNDPFVLATVLLLAGILLNLGYSTFLVYPMGIATKEKCPFAASLVNTAGSLGGAFAPFAVGVLLDKFNWDMVFTFLSVSSLMTLFILITMVEPVEDCEE